MTTKLHEHGPQLCKRPISTRQTTIFAVTHRASSNWIGKPSRFCTARLMEQKFRSCGLITHGSESRSEYAQAFASFRSIGSECVDAFVALSRLAHVLARRQYKTNVLGPRVSGGTKIEQRWCSGKHLRPPDYASQIPYYTISHRVSVPSRQSRALRTS
jgi:hypothetical protein